MLKIPILKKSEIFEDYEFLFKNELSEELPEDYNDKISDL